MTKLEHIMILSKMTTRIKKLESQLTDIHKLIEKIFEEIAKKP